MTFTFSHSTNSFFALSGGKLLAAADSYGTGAAYITRDNCRQWEMKAVLSAASAALGVELTDSNIS